MRAYMIYGFSEDAWHGRAFVRALQARGITVTSDIAEAHYVIAHSGGCFDIPPLQEHQLLMMINPPYWPERTLASRGRAMFMQMVVALKPGNQPWHRFYENCKHLLSLGTHARANWRIATRAKTFNLEQEVTHVNTILVRNKLDPWLTPKLGRLQKLNPHVSLVTLPGSHLHCWTKPEPYVDLLEQYKII